MSKRDGKKHSFVYAKKPIASGTQLPIEFRAAAAFAMREHLQPEDYSEEFARLHAEIRSEYERRIAAKKAGDK